MTGHSEGAMITTVDDDMTRIAERITGRIMIEGIKSLTTLNEEKVVLGLTKDVMTATVTEIELALVLALLAHDPVSPPADPHLHAPAHVQNLSPSQWRRRMRT